MEQNQELINTLLERHERVRQYQKAYHKDYWQKVKDDEKYKEKKAAYQREYYLKRKAAKEATK